MAVRVALSAFLTLFVAMGIGRFAFTPQVPLMIQEHQLTLTSASLVAALNYLGQRSLAAWGDSLPDWLGQRLGDGAGGRLEQ
jgi:hypothetical protein